MPARMVVVGLLTVCYIVASHWLMTSAPPSPWNAVGLLTPMLAAIAFGAVHARQFGRALLATAAIAALCAQAATGVLIPAPWLYLGQHVVINLMLGLWFGSTLRAGGQALITVMAARVHQRMPPALAAYTRNLTRVWTVYFFVIAAASTLLFFTLPFDRWAEFSNLVCPATIVMLFVGERLLRYRLHPEFERATIADQIRAYLQADAALPAAGRVDAGEPLA